MAWISYGYFVRSPNGNIIHSGHDFGQTPDTYKVGDSLGVKNCWEGIVIGVLKGRPAQLSGGYDVFVLVEQRAPLPPGAPDAPTFDFFQTAEGRVVLEMLTREPPRLVTRPQIQAVVGDFKFRAVGKTVHRRPLKESFYDFQLNHLLWHLGEEWFKAEMAKQVEKRHVIAKWRDERNEQLRKYQDPNDPGGLVRAPVTGGIRALQVLADDIYQLAHAMELPKKLIARLRDIREFQGARYEVAVASLFARCGCEIEFIDDDSKRTPEFIARKDGEGIAVEAKSRRRPGVLNERGDHNESSRAGIKRLYEDALGQNPGDCPFVIFIDVNLPLTPEVPPMERPWVRETLQAFDDRHEEGRQHKDTALVLTNFGWHFSREEGAPGGEHMWARVEHPKYLIRPEMLDLLGRAIAEYGKVVDEEERIA